MQENEVGVSAPGIKTLAQKMAAILGEVSRIPKSGHNKFQNYRYATEADALDAIRPLLSKHNIAVFFDCVEVQDLENNRTRVRVQVDLVCGDTGESRSSFAFGEARDADSKGNTQDKGIYKAITGAMKYWMFKTFMISTGDDPEDDSNQPPPHTSVISPKSSKPKPSLIVEKVRELIQYGQENGLEVARIRTLCKGANLPDASADYKTDAQVTTLAQLIEDEIAKLSTTAA